MRAARWLRFEKNVSPTYSTVRLLHSKQPSIHSNAILTQDSVSRSNRPQRIMRLFDMLHVRHEVGVFLMFLAFPVLRLGCFKNGTPDSITMSTLPDI